MKNSIVITENNIEEVYNKNIQLKVLQSIKSISDETIFNSENSDVLKKIIFKKSTSNSLTENQKGQVIDLALQIIQNTIHTAVIKSETTILQKINNLNEREFLDSFSKKLNVLKLQINKNKKHTSEFKKKSDTTSLNELANNINEYHNPNQSIGNIDKEVDDLLNGGTINF